MINRPPAHSAYQYRLRSDVKRELARLNLSQNRLAKLVGITSGFMSQLITGRRYVGPETRQRMMDRLPSLTFDQLFEEVNLKGQERKDEVSA